MLAKDTKTDHIPATKGFIKFTAFEIDKNDSLVERQVTMPLRILCCVIEYADKEGEILTKISDTYGRNVFFTREPKDSIDEKIAQATY